MKVQFLLNMPCNGILKRILKKVILSELQKASYSDVDFIYLNSKIILNVDIRSTECISEILNIVFNKSSKSLENEYLVKNGILNKGFSVKMIA